MNYELIYDTDRNRRLMQEAYTLAATSPDPSTQIGSFLVSYDGQLHQLTRTYNRPATGWDMKPEHWLHKPTKYAVVEHAERGAIYRAAKFGIHTAGATLVSNWAACADCARAMVQAGISCLLRHAVPTDDAHVRWLESIELGDRILKAGGVTIVEVKGVIPGAPTILRGGELFDPTQEEFVGRPALYRAT